MPPEAALRIRSARDLGAWLVEVSSYQGEVLAFAGNPAVQVAYDVGDIASELAPRAAGSSAASSRARWPSC